MTDVPDLSSDEEEFNEEDWSEMVVDPSLVVCLFCNSEFPEVEKALQHCDNVHDFKLPLLHSRHRMDDYSFIKLINYIKTHKPKAEVIMNAKTPLWESEEYLKPVHEDEWLMFDFESVIEHNVNHASEISSDNVTCPSELESLQANLRDLHSQLEEKTQLLNIALENMDAMKKSMHVLINSSDESLQNKVDCVAKLAVEDDEGYFNTYAHFSIHHTMLSDKVRTESYRDAIFKNNELLKDSIVLDLGCGTGILSMFAAAAGAKTVFAIDMSDIVYNAMQIVRDNNFEEKIKVIKGRLENTQLDQKVDFIISEWMGYFLLYEGMLDSVIYARDNYLKPGGRLLPNRCNISLVGSGDIETHKSLVTFWNDVYGYKMNCMIREVVREASVEIVDDKYIITKPSIVTEIDINTCTTDVINFTSDFSLPVIKDGMLTSIVGYFDTFFDLPDSVKFSTGPHVTATHWKQTVFYLKDAIAVKVGDLIKGKIICNRSRTDVRSLSVKIELNGKVHEYIMS